MLEEELLSKNNDRNYRSNQFRCHPYLIHRIDVAQFNICSSSVAHLQVAKSSIIHKVWMLIVKMLEGVLKD